MSITPVSINSNVQTNLLSPLSDTQQTSAPTPTYTPLWMVNDGASSNSLEMLGIRMPSAVGDLAVLIAQASLTLDQTSDEARKNQALAGLAGLSASLAAFDLSALNELASRKQVVVNDAQTETTDFTDAVGPLQTDLATANSNISADKSTISSLQAQLAALDPKAKDYDTQKAALEGQLTTAQNALHTDLVARGSIDAKIAQAQVDTLDEQITDVTAELAAAPSGSDEAKALQDELTALTGKRDGIQSSLATFKGLASPSDAQLESFSSTNATNLASVTNDLAIRLSGGKADLATVSTAINNAAYAALTLAAQAVAGFATEQSTRATHHASLDSNIERAFDEIGEELQQVDARLSQQSQKADDNQHDSLRRIEQLSQGLVAGLAGIVSALAQLADEGQTGPSNPAPAGRVKFNI